MDLGGVGDSFFTLVGDTLGALEKILRVGERFGVWDFGLAKGFAEADLLCPAEVLNKLSVGERLGDDDVIFDGVSFPFKPAFDDDGEDEDEEDEDDDE